VTAYGYVGGDPSKLNVAGYSQGDVVAADNTGHLQRVAVGTSGNVLTANSGAAEGVDWQPAGGSGGGVPSSRKITATAPITGGGDLSVDRVIGFDPTQVPLNAFSEGQVAGLISDLNTLATSIAARALASRIISATSPLTGGGDLTQDRSIGFNPANVANGAFTEAQVAGLVTDLTNINTAINGKQASAAGLTSLAALNGAGFVIATSASVYSVRALNASDIPALDAGKITTGVMNQNRLPTPDAVQNLVSGAWYAIPNQGSVSQTAALTANTALLILLCIMRDATLTGLAVEVVATDTGTIRFGLASDTNGQPGSYTNDFGTVTAGGAGLVQPASTPNVALTAGTRMWVVIAPQGGGGTLTLRNRSGCDPSIPLTVASNVTPRTVNAIRNAYTSVGVSGALGSGGVSLSAVGSGPVVACRLT